jgi:phosphoribosylamine--glycine ligase
MNKKLKILIIGSGGREHAIGWKILQSTRCGELYFAPGNAGTREVGINVPIKATDIQGLIDYVKNESIDLTLAIPDDPLALGIVDEFNKEGLRIFGPTKQAAQLESSKAYAKNFMSKYNLPTAFFETFTDFNKAEAYVRSHVLPVVIKVSGLALGKGVFICEKLEDALFTLENILVKKKFGEAGREVVVEEFLVGTEISTHAFSDGKTFSMFPASQDHKRIGENDTGPNTGGMGTICPLPFVSNEILLNIKDTIISATLSSMNKDDNRFSGVIYPGLMLTNSGPKILEYNARFGDPETQTYMRLLNTDLLDIIDACIDGNLDKIEIDWFKKIFACTIIIASKGYPEAYEKGNIIDGIKMAEKDENVVIFHSGTIMKDGNLVTNGGRVLCVSATGESLEKALETAYKAVEKISFNGMQYRKDIGKKALALLA